MRSLLAIVLAAGLPALANAGDQFRVPFTLTSHQGYSDTAWFGVDPAATNCIDPSLGEIAAPPLPPSAGLVFTIGTPCPHEYLRLDLRPFVSDTQTDVYRVVYSGMTEDYPLTFSWPNLDATYLNDVWLTDGTPSGLRINMKLQTSVTISDSLATGRLVITTGSNPVAQQAKPSVLSQSQIDLTQSSVHLFGYVSPNALTTSSWFEWGPTDSYGNAIAAHAIGNGSAGTGFDDLLTGLTPKTLYHYRIAAQNSLGTSYGPDGTFMTIPDGEIGKYVLSLKAESGGSSWTLWMGVHPDATSCIDANLGEYEGPPPPPGFYAELTGSPTLSCLWSGVNIDFRHLGSASQVDTFRIRLGLLTDSATLRWPDVTGWFSGAMHLVDAYGGLAVNVDMTAQQSIDISADAPPAYYIVAGTPASLVPQPGVLTAAASNISSQSVEANGLVQTNGLQTDAWFEWGAGSVNEHATGHQSLAPSGTAMPVSLPLDGLTAGTQYHYRVVASNQAGVTPGPERLFTTSAVLSAGDLRGLPNRFALLQNYPNPFNPSTQIQYTLANESRVTLRVFNVLGEEVATLIDRLEPAGAKTVRFDASRLAGGVYFYTLRAGSQFSETKRLVLLK